MSKLMLSLHLNRPDVFLTSNLGFRVFDYQSLRLCDQAIREGCFGRHTKKAFVAYGPIVGDSVPPAVAGVRTPESAKFDTAEPNVDVFVRGLGTLIIRVGFSFDWDDNSFPNFPQGRLSLNHLRRWERFCEALGRRDLVLTKNVQVRDGAFWIERSVMFPSRAQARKRRASV